MTILYSFSKKKNNYLLNNFNIFDFIEIVLKYYILLVRNNTI